MAKYTRKAGVVEARQWWPPGDPRHDPAMLTHRKGNTVNPPDYRKVGDLYQLSTIPGMGDNIFLLRCVNGELRVHPGDWIVTKDNGKVWVVEGVEFQECYGALEEAGVPLTAEVAEMRRLRALGREYHHSYKQAAANLAPALADAWERAVAELRERDAEIARLQAVCAMAWEHLDKYGYRGHEDQIKSQEAVFNATRPHVDFTGRL